ncbi:hypothetical protein [Tautonia marina]|uniref:hypothetical protein n=1 Tax=Tautonia marina TaxID=2653855 RepID=UPI0012607DB3|nr:hypothetical protein [Tautonia marina]
MTTPIGPVAFSLVILGTLTSFGVAQEVSAALRDRVAQLVEQLGEEGTETRDNAEQALTKLGARILPLLPDPAEVDEADLRDRLARIRSALEVASTENVSEASRITIQGDGIRLSEVLRELQRQSGNRISDLRELYGQDATNPALDLQINDLPFLEAFDLIAEKAGLEPVFYTGDGTIGLLTQGAMEYGEGEGTGSAPTIYTGPFRVSLNQIAAQHDLTTGARSTNAQVMVVWEPRLRPMLMNLDVSNVEIVDDRGQEVMPSVSEEAGTVVLRPENPTAELNLNMASPDRKAQQIDRLKVRATLTVPSGNEVFRLDLGTPTPSQEQGDVTVSVGRVEVDGFVWKVDVRVTYEGQSEAFETYRQGLFNNRLWLQRPDGSRFEQNGGFNQIGASANSMAFQYLFVDAPGKPSDYQLVYETPGAVLELPLEFEFTDVPLP